IPPYLSFECLDRAPPSSCGRGFKGSLDHADRNAGLCERASQALCIAQSCGEVERRGTGRAIGWHCPVRLASIAPMGELPPHRQIEWAANFQQTLLPVDAWFAPHGQAVLDASHAPCETGKLNVGNAAGINHARLARPQACAHADGAVTGKPRHEVRHVSATASERATAGQAGIGDPTRMLLAKLNGFYVANGANTAAPNNIPGALACPVQPAIEGHTGKQAARRGVFGELTCLGTGEHEGLIDQDGLRVREASRGMGAMKTMWRADDDRIACVIDPQIIHLCCCSRSEASGRVHNFRRYP